jgi:16S rRNA (cytosine967-C5)-methyltransferase
MARDELRLLCLELRELGADQGAKAEALAHECRHVLGFIPDVAAIVRPDAGLGASTGLEREAIRHSYPTWMIERFVADLGESAALALAASMNQRAPLAVRANTVKIGRDDLVARLGGQGVVARPTSLSPAGAIFETRMNAFGLPAFQEGLFEVMDEGSQLVAEAVAPPPRARVVDACAGAGGKTLALAAQMQGQGRILALDRNGKKLEELRRRARRASLSNVMARHVDARGGPDAIPAEARLSAWDRVLVDAPCSGVGTLRRNPEARWRLDPRTAGEFPAQQVGLLVAYAPLVAVGGRLVYATCSLFAAENEGVVQRFLAERSDFALMPLKEIWGGERARQLGDGTFLRLCPHTHGTDGFFAASLRRLR